MTISFNIQPTILILLGISFVLTLLFFLYDFIRFKSLKKSLEKSNFLKNQKNKHIEGVSVVIYADNDSTYLNQNLPLILGQDYPLFEVIVVCNGKDESTIDIVEKYAQMHSNLHFSFIPDDARNLSRKKLALMLGIKAAAFDIIITTNGNCSPYTTQWISSIAQHFQNGIDVVIGHSTPIGKGAQLSNYQKFISQENSLKYLSQAIIGKPYRGTSDNLAYRKSIFFDNKGFSRSMHLHHGEDDLFINEITTNTNTHVELSHESSVLAEYSYIRHAFRNTKLRRNFTENRIRSIAFPLTSFKDFSILLATITSISAICLDYTNLVTIIAVILIATLSLCTYLILQRKIYQIIRISDISILTPFFAFCKPLTEMIYKIRSRRHKTSNYTWQPLHK